MTKEHQQAIFEINRTLNHLISAFQFVPEKGERDIFEGVMRMRGDYAAITIWADERLGEGTLTHLIRARGSVCQMNPNADTNELRWAASQIQRAAGLVDAINALELHYTEDIK